MSITSTHAAQPPRRADPAPAPQHPIEQGIAGNRPGIVAPMANPALPPASNEAAHLRRMNRILLAVQQPELGRVELRASLLGPELDIGAFDVIAVKRTSAGMPGATTAFSHVQVDAGTLTAVVDGQPRALGPVAFPGKLDQAWTVQRGSPADVIAGAAERIGADLTVLAGSGRPLLPQWIRPSRNADVVHLCRSAVLLVHTEPAQAYQTVVVAIDFSRACLCAARTAALGDCRLRTAPRGGPGRRGKGRDVSGGAAVVRQGHAEADGRRGARPPDRAPPIGRGPRPAPGCVTPHRQDARPHRGASRRGLGNVRSAQDRLEEAMKSHRTGSPGQDAAVQARLRMGRGKRRLARTVLARNARWRRLVARAMAAGMAAMIAGQWVFLE